MPTRAVWIYAVKVVVVVRVAFLAVAGLAAWMVEPGAVGTPDLDWLQIWRRWDAHNLLRLAEEGYLRSEPNHAAYFPLFPMLVRAVSWTGISTVLAGLIVSAIASVLSVAYLRMLAEEQFPGSGVRAGLYLAVFPMAVFLVAPYTEALFLAGAIGAFYMARRQRWIAAGLWAAVASGARATGLFLLAALAVAWATGPRRRATYRRAIAGLLIGALPLVAYTVYMRVVFGSWTHFLTAQERGWGRRFTNPIVAFRRTWGAGGEDSPTDWLIAWRIEVIAAAIGIAFVAYLLWRRLWPYAVYCGLSLGVLLASTWFYSIPRAMVTWFPMPMALAAWSLRREGRHEVVLVASTALAILGVITFTRGAWFF